MQSPNEITPPRPIDAERIRTRALATVVLAVFALAVPLVLAVLFYLVSVAAMQWHAMVGALRGYF